MMIPISLLFLFTTFQPCDSISYIKIGSIPGKIDFFSTDDLGNIYTVQNDSILLYNYTFVLEHRYSNKLLGHISSLDVQWSLKPVLFYQESKTIIYCDNTLSPQGTSLTLQGNNLEYTQIICTSVNNQLWLYNPFDYELIKATGNLTTQIVTTNLNQQINDDFNPVFMLEKDNRLYLCDSVVGIVVFDQFGTYLNTLPITGIRNFSVSENKIYYDKNRQFFCYDMKSFSEIILPFPPIKNNVEDIQFVKNRIYVQTKSGITVYKIVHL